MRGVMSRYTVMRHASKSAMLPYNPFYDARRLMPPRRLFTASSGPTEHKVTLDHETLYISQELAEALGWTPGGSPAGVELRLQGEAPHLLTITRVDTESGQCAPTLVVVVLEHWNANRMDSQVSPPVNTKPA
jgi:hypothetical protein